MCGQWISSAKRALAHLELAQQDAAGDRLGFVGFAAPIIGVEHGRPNAHGNFRDQDFLQHRAQFLPVGRQVVRFVAAHRGELFERAQPAVETALGCGPVLVQGRGRDPARAFNQHRTMRRSQSGHFDQFAGMHGKLGSQGVGAKRTLTREPLGTAGSSADLGKQVDGERNRDAKPMPGGLLLSTQARFARQKVRDSKNLTGSCGPP